MSFSRGVQDPESLQPTGGTDAGKQDGKPLQPLSIEPDTDEVVSKWAGCIEKCERSMPGQTRPQKASCLFLVFATTILTGVYSAVCIFHEFYDPCVDVVTGSIQRRLQGKGTDCEEKTTEKAPCLFPADLDMRKFLVDKTVEEQQLAIFEKHEACSSCRTKAGAGGKIDLRESCELKWKGQAKMIAGWELSRSLELEVYLGVKAEVPRHFTESTLVDTDTLGKQFALLKEEAEKVTVLALSGPTVKDDSLEVKEDSFQDIQVIMKGCILDHKRAETFYQHSDGNVDKALEVCQARNALDDAEYNYFKIFQPLLYQSVINRNQFYRVSNHLVPVAGEVTGLALSDPTVKQDSPEVKKEKSCTEHDECKTPGYVAFCIKDAEQKNGKCEVVNQETMLSAAIRDANDITMRQEIANKDGRHFVRGRRIEEGRRRGLSYEMFEYKTWGSEDPRSMAVKVAKLDSKEEGISIDKVEEHGGIKITKEVSQRGIEVLIKDFDACRFLHEFFIDSQAMKDLRLCGCAAPTSTDDKQHMRAGTDFAIAFTSQFFTREQNAAGEIISIDNVGVSESPKFFSWATTFSFDSTTCNTAPLAVVVPTRKQHIILLEAAYFMEMLEVPGYIFSMLNNWAGVSDLPMVFDKDRLYQGCDKAGQARDLWAIGQFLLEPNDRFEHPCGLRWDAGDFDKEKLKNQVQLLEAQVINNVPVVKKEILELLLLPSEVPVVERLLRALTALSPDSIGNMDAKLEPFLLKAAETKAKEAEQARAKAAEKNEAKAAEMVAKVQATKQVKAVEQVKATNDMTGSKSAAGKVGLPAITEDHAAEQVAEDDERLDAFAKEGSLSQSVLNLGGLKISTSEVTESTNVGSGSQSPLGSPRFS